MSMDQADPLVQMLRSPGAIGRILAVALAAASIFLPAISGVTGDKSTSYLVSYVWVFPGAICVAMAISAIPTVSRYARLADLAAAILGGSVCMGLIGPYNESAFILRNAGSSMMEKLNPDGSPLIGLGLGAWALGTATSIMLAVALFVRPRRAD